MDGGNSQEQGNPPREPFLKNRLLQESRHDGAFRWISSSHGDRMHGLL
jgi:hypothetical protein